jgi:hypothetical protein
MGPGFSASSGVVPCQYDFICAHYSSTSAALVYNVAEEKVSVAVAHHSIVDQAAVIKNIFTLIAVYFNPETVTFLLPDKKIVYQCFFEAFDNYFG